MFIHANVVLRSPGRFWEVIVARDIDFFFFHGSTYTYLSVVRIAKRASAANVAVRWRPFNVRQIMVDMDNIPFGKKPVKAAYL